MKIATRFLVCFIVLGLIFGNESTALAAQLVKLSAGTPVILRLQEKVSSKTATMGQKVLMLVEADVMSQGVVLIKKGAPAFGEVTETSSAGMVGSAGSLTLTAQMVQAADGQMIPISLNKSAKGKSKLATSVIVTVLCCILALLIRGEDVVFEAGSLQSGFTLSQAEISI